jgi:hypothetical protein
MDYVCDKSQKQCFAINDKLQKYFYDSGHHTLEGAKFLGHKIDEIKWLRKLNIAI